MTLIQITEFISRKEAEETYNRFYRFKSGSHLVKKTFISNYSSVYAVARYPTKNEHIPSGHALSTDFYDGDKIKIEIVL